jgi:hypothetical protein
MENRGQAGSLNHLGVEVLGIDAVEAEQADLAETRARLVPRRLHSAAAERGVRPCHRQPSWPTARSGATTWDGMKITSSPVQPRRTARSVWRSAAPRTIASRPRADTRVVIPTRELVKKVRVAAEVFLDPARDDEKGYSPRASLM